MAQSSFKARISNPEIALPRGFLREARSTRLYDNLLTTGKCLAVGDLRGKKYYNSVHLFTLRIHSSDDVIFG
ncbi:hypothetical protein EAE99_011734 [Botrytis elliptica]|nr:hypothetical protein EAE99_011734 [Botrytis elliptica]